jgi:hypothetical protein
VVEDKGCRISLLLAPLQIMDLLVVVMHIRKNSPVPMDDMGRSLELLKTTVIITSTLTKIVLGQIRSKIQESQ